MNWITSLTICGMILLGIVCVATFGLIPGFGVGILVIGFCVGIVKLLQKRLGNPDDVFRIERMGVTPAAEPEASKRTTSQPQRHQNTEPPF